MNKESQLPIVALVGLPNTGKSTLLNRISGNKQAVTSKVAGTTRDRQYAKTTWNDFNFLMVDTAGIMNESDSELNDNVQKQIDTAINEAEILILVVDAKSPKESIERDVLIKLRRIKKPLILAVNKSDSVLKSPEYLATFSALGIKKSYAVSALTGNGIGDLLDCIVEELKAIKPSPEELTPKDSIAVSIVGRPNVGKSTLFNSILKEDRVVVSSVPGTTRTSIDSQLTIDGENYTFIDTAGLKRKSYRQEEPDVYSVFQTFKSIRRSDVVLLLLEATETIIKQDQRIAGEIQDMEKGLILVVNKMDEYQGSQEALQDYISLHFPQAWMSPVFFISAKNHKGIPDVISAIKPIFEARHKVIEQETLNHFLHTKLKTQPPKRLMDQKVPKVYSLKQVSTNPPMFELLVNHPAAISKAFRQMLSNAIIRELEFWGTPVVLKLKGKDKK